MDALSEAGQAPQDEYDLKHMVRAERFDAALLEAYARRCGDVFDLFHPERPFLQTVAAAGGEKPLAAIYPAVPSGTNVDHWHHATEDAMGASPAGAARLLATMAPFMTAGGAGLSPAINGAPAIYAMPMGRNLFETIVLNLPLRQGGTGTGRVVWRDERVPGGERAQATMGEALTWRARRVRLVPPKDGSRGEVVRMLFQAGDSTRLTWTDPNLAYKYEGEGQTPVRMRAGRPLWRDAGPLALLNRSVYKAQEGKVEYRRPDVVEDAFAAMQGPLRIRVYGMRTDLKMKVFEWSVADLVVPSEVGRSARVGAQVQRWLDCAELAGRSVRNALRNLYPREGAGNKAALGRTVEGAERGYWLALEPEFGALMRARGGARGERRGRSGEGRRDRRALEGGDPARGDRGVRERGGRLRRGRRRPRARGEGEGEAGRVLEEDPGMNGTEAKEDSASAFVGRVERLGNGELAQLRRAAGDRLGDRAELLWFAGYTRGERTEAVDFLVTTLLAQYRTVDIRSGAHRGKGDFGATWKRAIGPSPSDSIQRRFHILLDGDLAWDGSGDLPYRLRQMVRYAAAKGVGLDWPRLLKDLGNWEHPGRYVQKRWARSFFSDFHDATDDASE